MKKKLLLLLAAFLVCFSLKTEAFAASVTTKDINSKQALQLAQSARQHYWNVMSGRDLSLKNSKCIQQTFKYKGQYYRYFCKEYGTKEKLVHYMNEVYTLNAIGKAFKEYGFIEYKGKMAQHEDAGGSTFEWNKAKAKLIFSKTDVRLYEFTVPVENSRESRKMKVTFVKVNKEWKINSFDAVM